MGYNSVAIIRPQPIRSWGRGFAAALLPCDRARPSSTCCHAVPAVASDGECPTSSSGSNAACLQEIACLSVIDYMCGSDGKTYNNACELGKAKCETPSLTQASTGECKNGAASAHTKSGCKTTKCTTIFQPVCGSDGVTYSNMCAFKNAQCTAASPLSLKANGPCDGSSDDA